MPYKLLYGRVLSTTHPNGAVPDSDPHQSRSIWRVLFSTLAENDKDRG